MGTITDEAPPPHRTRARSVRGAINAQREDEDVRALNFDMISGSGMACFKLESFWVWFVILDGCPPRSGLEECVLGSGPPFEARLARP